MRLWIVISLFVNILISFAAYSQTYNYNYTDPCSGVLKTIVVPINSDLAVSYYGSVGNFGYDDFVNGTFESWASGIFDQFGQNSPCATVVGVSTVFAVTQNTTFTVLGILNSLSTIADIAGSGASNILGGSVSSIGNSGNNDNKNEDKNGNNSNNSNSNNSGSISVSNNGSATTNPNNNEAVQGTSSSPSSSESTSSSEGNSGTGTETQSGSSSESVSGTSGTGSSEGESEIQSPEIEVSEESGGSTNITGGATTTTKNAPGKSEGGKPSVVASGDFVGFNFRNSEVRTGAKATGGYTALRWDGQRSWGAMADYTTALRGPNVTAFYAWIGPKAVTLLSGTATIGFEGNRSLYGTIAAGQMFSFKKVPRLKAIYMGTVSYGHIFRESFIGTAVIAGAMYDLKIGNRVDIKLMNLMVYAPYVSYYNDIVLSSPYVMLPSIGTNIGITKRFKFNINAGGAWDLRTAALNYTVTCGTRLLIGQ